MRGAVGKSWRRGWLAGRWREVVARALARGGALGSYASIWGLPYRGWLRVACFHPGMGG